MPRWLQILILIGVVMDLVISGVLLSQQQQIDHNSAKNDCWSHILDQAILHPTKAYQSTLREQARHCVNLP